MSYVFESLDDFLFEDLGNLKKFGLPKELIQKIMNGSGWSSRIAGRESLVEEIPNAKDYKALTAALKPEFTAGIISISGKPKYLFHRMSERKFKLYDIESIQRYEDDRRKRNLESKKRQNENLNERRGGYSYSRETGLYGEFSAQSLSDFLKDQSKNGDITVELIRPDKAREEKHQQRWKQNSSNPDPLKQSGSYSPEASLSQRARYNKYSTKKRTEIDKKVDIEREKIREQLHKNFDKAFDKILQDLRKGYAWNADAKHLGEEIMRGLDLSGFQNLAKAYDAVEPNSSNPSAAAKASQLLKKTGYL